MKITIVAHPKSKTEKIVKLDERYYEAYFFAVPEKGKANQKLKELLANYFNVPKSSIDILHGEKSTLKIIEIVES